MKKILSAILLILFFIVSSISINAVTDYDIGNEPKNIAVTKNINDIERDLEDNKTILVARNVSGTEENGTIVEISLEKNNDVFSRAATFKTYNMRISYFKKTLLAITKVGETKKVASYKRDSAKGKYYFYNVGNLTLTYASAGFKVSSSGKHWTRTQAYQSARWSAPGVGSRSITAVATMTNPTVGTISFTAY